jgi:hypothetical protein
MIWRLGFGAHVVRVFVCFAHRFLSNSRAPKRSFSKFRKFSFPYQRRWVGAHFATSSVSLGMEPLIYSRSPNQEVPKIILWHLGGGGWVPKEFFLLN